MIPNEASLVNDTQISTWSFHLLSLWLGLRERFKDPESLLLQQELKEGQTVVDYGCGIGSYTLPAARIVGKDGTVYAIDINPLALRKVRKRAKRAGYSNIHTIQTHTPTGLPAQCVDAVLLYDVLHSVSDPAALLAELHRILKPGGFLSVLPDHLSHDQLLERTTADGLFSWQDETSGVHRFTRTPTIPATLNETRTAQE